TVLIPKGVYHATASSERGGGRDGVGLDRWQRGQRGAPRPRSPPREPPLLQSPWPCLQSRLRLRRARPPPLVQESLESQVPPLPLLRSLPAVLLLLVPGRWLLLPR